MVLRAQEGGLRFGTRGCANRHQKTKAEPEDHIDVENRGIYTDFVLSDFSVIPFSIRACTGKESQARTSDSDRHSEHKHRLATGGAGASRARRDFYFGARAS